MHTRTRIRHRSNDLTGLPKPGELQSLALPARPTGSRSPTLLADVFKRKRPGQADEDLLPADPAAILEGQDADLGGDVAMDGGWWIPSRTVFYMGTPQPQPMSWPRREPTSSFLADSEIHSATTRQCATVPRLPARLDRTCSLPEPVDPPGNTVSAVNDYRVLQPRLVTDANRNRNASPLTRWAWSLPPR
jgi:hypothetical protein